MGLTPTDEGQSILPVRQAAAAPKDVVQPAAAAAVVDDEEEKEMEAMRARLAKLNA